MADKRSRFEEIDILRGMAILMVLLYHSIIVYPVNLHEIPWCASLHSFLWTLQMPLFFFVSGFCYPTGRIFTGDSFNNYLKYTGSKIKRILIPHLFFGILDIIPRLIPNPLVNEALQDPGEAFSFLLIYGGSDWFLLTLFIICLIFPLAEAFLYGDNPKIRLSVLLAVSLAVYVFHSKFTDILCLNMVAGFFIFFLMGFLLRKYIENPQTKDQCSNAFPLPHINRVALLIVFLVASIITYYIHIRTNLRLTEFIFVLFAGCFCMYISKMVKTPSCPENVKAFFILCGTWSLQMYLLDSYALVFTRTLITGPLGIKAPFLIILGNFIPDIIIVLFITLFILRKFRIFRFVSGIKEPSE